MPHLRPRTECRERSCRVCVRPRQRRYAFRETPANIYWSRKHDAIVRQRTAADFFAMSSDELRAEEHISTGRSREPMPCRSGLSRIALRRFHATGSEHEPSTHSEDGTLSGSVLLRWRLTVPRCRNATRPTSGPSDHALTAGDRSGTRISVTWRKRIPENKTSSTCHPAEMFADDVTGDTIGHSRR